MSERIGFPAATALIGMGVGLWSWARRLRINAMFALVERPPKVMLIEFTMWVWAEEGEVWTVLRRSKLS